MTFMGIPVSGSMTEFSKKLAEKGFVLENSKDKDLWKYTGSFLNKECELYLVGTQITQTVWKVLVAVPASSNWYSLKSDYNSVCDKLTNKYGVPENTFNFFSDPYYEGDGYEITAIKNEKCTYSKYWKLPYGTISCQIMVSTDIGISYESKAGTELKHKEENERAAEQL
jgi:hypothetical protein